MRPFAPSCCVYEIPDGFFIHSQSRTVVGLTVYSEPARRMDGRAESDEIGDAVIEVLEGCKSGLPHPKDWMDWDRTTTYSLNTHGVSSFHWLQRHGRLVHVRKVAGTFQVTPSSNGGIAGDQRGFHDLIELMLGLPEGCTSVQLGSAILRQMKLCTVLPPVEKPRRRKR